MSKSYSQKVEEWLLEKSGCHLVDFCKRFNYKPLIIKLIQLDETDEKKTKLIIAKDPAIKELYISCSKDPLSIKRKGDNRSWTQYFKDLITGWVLEDLVLEMLSSQGLEVTHNGKDAQRQISIGSGVSQEADLCITVGGVTRKVELTNEFNSMLANYGYIEKRCPSLINLWEAKGIWIYRDMKHNSYVLVDFATEKIKLHLRKHNNTKEDWAKDVHRFVLEENGKKIRNEKLLIAEIISVVGCSIEGKPQPPIEEVIDEDSPPIDFEKRGKKKTKDSPKEQPKENERKDNKTPKEKVEEEPRKDKPVPKPPPPPPPPPPTEVALSTESEEDEEYEYEMEVIDFE